MFNSQDLPFKIPYLVYYFFYYDYNTMPLNGILKSIVKLHNIKLAETNIMLYSPKIIGIKLHFQKIPLTLANIGEENTIKRIGGKPEVKKHLENLGFVVGGNVTVITTMGGNVIVNVKEARIAISQEMAQKVMV